MLKLRLKRIGRRHDPSFRVVVTENTTPPKGKYLEAVGFYNARLKQLKLNNERIKYWLGVGIQPTDTVHNLLVKEGILTSKKRSVHSTRVRKKEEVNLEKSAEDKKSDEGETKSKEASNESVEVKKEEAQEEKTIKTSDATKDFSEDSTKGTEEVSKKIIKESESKDKAKSEATSEEKKVEGDED